jgi:flagellar protein FliL
MSDEEVFPDDDLTGGDDDGGGSQKVGFLPAIVITILKYVALGLLGIIFIVTVVVITVNILNKGQTNQLYPEISSSYEGKSEILDWWSGIDDIRTSTADEQPYTVLVSVKIGYKKNDKSILTELNGRQPQLQEDVLNYYSSKTVSYLKTGIDTYVKSELKEIINNQLASSQIVEVVILNFQSIQM